MKVTDAATVFTETALELSTMPREMAAAIHAAGAGQLAHEVASQVKSDNTVASPAEVWAGLRDGVDDPEDLPALDKPVAALRQAIADIRAAWPTV